MLSRTLWYYAIARRNYRLDSRELQKFRNRRFRKGIRHAYDNIPLYHEWLRSRGLRPDDFRTTDDLARLPTLSRGTVLENYPGGITDSSISTAVTRRTTGTTGPALTVRWAARYADLALGVRMRRMYVWGVRSWNKAMWISYFGAVENVDGKKARPSFLKKTGRVLFGPVLVQHPVLRRRVLGMEPENLSEAAKALVEYNPTLLQARPSYLRKIGNILKDEYPNFCVRKVVGGGELITAGCRSDLTMMYRGDVYDSYGAHEVGALGFECSAHSGLHLNSDFFVFEFLGKDGQPATEGERAEILLTSLENEAMPLIRYRLGDTVIPETEEKCACGSSLTRLRRIEGRVVDGLYNEQDIPIPPGTVIEYIESRLGLRDFQLIQIGRRKIIVKLAPKDDTPKVSQALRTYLQSILSENVVVETDIWDDTERPMKYRPIVRRDN